MNILQEIFKDNYEIIQYTLHPRDVEMENISKMIHCGTPSYGGAMFACAEKFVSINEQNTFGFNTTKNILKEIILNEDFNNRRKWTTGHSTYKNFKGRKN